MSEIGVLMLSGYDGDIDGGESAGVELNEEIDTLLAGWSDACFCVHTIGWTEGGEDVDSAVVADLAPEREFSTHVDVRWHERGWTLLAERADLQHQVVVGGASSVEQSGSQ